MTSSRREFLCSSTALFAAAADTIAIDPKPMFDISPHLYMQFMEPLGNADTSVEASWDYERDDWRPDFVEAVRDLAPGCIRWGGLYSRYYKWREGVGPANRRPLSRNYVWGGRETNRVGTHEFVDLCRRTGAEPLMCVNFLGDGQAAYARAKEGNRTGDAAEAADWVSYANDLDNAERKRNGAGQPLGIRYWQLGNETSYGKECFSREESIAHTIEFSKAMKRRDPSIQILGWGDRAAQGPLWAPELLRRAGEHVDLVAVHMMGMQPRRPNTVLRGLEYQKRPETAWQELIELSGVIEGRIAELREVMRPYKQRIAITEGHLGLGMQNAHPILTEWLSAVYHARCLNIYQRNGDLIRIATACDFQGTRWTVNAVMLPVPRGRSYLLPVGSIMRLFKRYNGRQGVAVTSAPAGLDVCASRSDRKIYLHVANLNYARAVTAGFTVGSAAITRATVYVIAPESPRMAVNVEMPAVFRPVQIDLGSGPSFRWTFPAASVSAVELELGA